MYGSSTPDIDPIWFLPLFVLGWCAVCAFLSLKGGWHTLSQLYSARNRLPSEIFRFASMGLGLGYFPVGYGSCLTIQVGTEGIGLSILPLFRILHPPLFIPWSAVSDCKQEKFWFLTHRALYLAEPKTRLLFRGRVAAAVSNYWERHRLSQGRERN